MLIEKWGFTLPVLLGIELIRRRGLRRMLSDLREDGVLAAGTRVLDVGSGSGMVVKELLELGGLQVTAAEPSPLLASYVSRRFPAVPLIRQPAEDLSAIADQSFDVVVVSAVMHGLHPSHRARVYGELRRVARKHVVVIDYHRNANPVVALVEALEGGDYFRFVEVVDDELRGAFPRVITKRYPGVESVYQCDAA